MDFIEALFLGVLNMSVTGSYVIIAVLILRLFLKRAPKIYSYGLWGIVLFRLICPFSFSSALSFLRILPGSTGRMEHIPADIGLAEQPQVDLGIGSINNVINGSLPAATDITASANPMQILLFVYSNIWLLGVVSLLIYSIYTYGKLKQKLDTAMLFENNIFESDKIESPFVIGLIKPKIYLPIGLSASERSYILKHEQTHIKRFDYLLKPLAFLVLCLHWFNPLVWISFLLMSRDMEMSCDESVLKHMGPEIKKDYSNSLLSFAVSKRIISGSPLAFGEQSAKIRIENVLKYRRFPAWIAVITLILLVIISVGLISNPEARSEFADQEKSTMAANWAEALKTRDGEPRYEMMSEEMKEKFVAQQMEQSDPWNFVIGSSSPWVTDYEITVKEDSAEILYHMTDSTQEKYDQREIIYFGKENGKVVVVKSEELLSEWERYNYFAPSAEAAMEVYTNALLASDYSTILSLTHSSAFEPTGQQIWDTIKINDIKVINSDIRMAKACYQLELNIEDGGESAFEKGVFPRWLWLVKGEQGWYVEGLMTGGAPDSNWWNKDAAEGNVAVDPFFGTGSEAAGTYRFDSLLYLSLLSSSTFDYAESRMKDTLFVINTNRFEINYTEDDDYVLSRPAYTIEKMDEDMVRSFEKSTMNTVSISEYKVKYRYTVFTEDNQKTGFRFYILDNELWLSSYADNTADKSEITMYLCKLK